MSALPPNHTRPSYAYPNAVDPSRQQHHAPPTNSDLSLQLSQTRQRPHGVNRNHPPVPVSVPHALLSAQPQRRVTDAQLMRMGGSRLRYKNTSLSLCSRFQIANPVTSYLAIVSQSKSFVARRAYKHTFLTSATLRCAPARTQSDASAPTPRCPTTGAGNQMTTTSRQTERRRQHDFTHTHARV